MKNIFELQKPFRSCPIIRVIVFCSCSIITFQACSKPLNEEITFSSHSVDVGLFRQTIELALKGGHKGACGVNLNPKTGALKGPNKDKGLGVVEKLTVGNKTMETGKNYTGNLQIIKMELKEDTIKDPKTGITNKSFVVYYRYGQGHFGGFSNTWKCQPRKGDQKESLKGCYYYSCLLKYGLNNDNEVTTCSLLNCHGNHRMGEYKSLPPCKGEYCPKIR